jgi:putative hemolysin
VNTTVFEILIIIVLLMANGIFAMAEIAVVSSRRARLKKFADEGSSKAKAALALAEEPTRFLSTVQIGITTVGIFAGAFGGATLSGKLAALLATFPAIAPASQLIAIVVVVGGITYFSLIIGELVPKRIALANPEHRAMLVAKPMTALAKVAGPVVSFLSKSTDVILKLLGLSKQVESPPSEEEIAHLIRLGTTAGVFHRAEERMVEGVLQLDERRVTELMTRRSKLVCLDVNDPDEANWRKIVTSGHSHFPVYQENRDNIIGLVSVKSLWAHAAAGLTNHLRNHLVPPLYVPETVTAVELVETFRRTGKHLALVTDEFGSIQGLVTLIDIMEAIVGDLPEPGDRPEPTAVKRDDGSWLVDAAVSMDEAERIIGLVGLEKVSEGLYETLGGFVIHRLGHIPRTGEAFTANGWRFEVVDMDRHRIDKLLVSAPPLTDLTASP